MDMEFTTKIMERRDISIYGIPKYLDLDKDTEIDDCIAVATVKWHVEIEAREWGIKGIMSMIDSVEIDAEVEYYAADDLECEDKIYKNFVLESKDFEIKDEMKINGDMLCPDEIEVDLDKKTITVSTHESYE